MATLQDVRTATQDILSDLTDSSIYFESYLDRLINEEQRTICDSWKWSFLRSKRLFHGAAKTALSEDIDSTADVTIDIDDTENFQVPGAVYIDYDIINYTGKTDDSLTGVTNIDITHEAGAQVRPLIPLPSDFNRMPEVRIIRSNATHWIPFTYIVEYEYDQFRNWQKFTLVTGTDEVQYLMINDLYASDQVIFQYLKKPTVMVEDDDVCTIPDIYATSVLSRKVAARAMMERGDNVDGVGEAQMAMANQALLDMKKKYGEYEQGFAKALRSDYSVANNAEFNNNTRYYNSGY